MKTKNLFIAVCIIANCLLPIAFSLAQSLTTITPASANNGQSLIVTITGTATNFQQGSGLYNVWFEQGSTTINAFTFTATSNTSLNADFTIPLNAKTGNYDVKVNDSFDGVLTMPGGFFIQGPEITVVNPDTAKRGPTLTVSITGLNTQFTQGSGVFAVRLKKGASNITASSFTVFNNTSLNATFTIPFTALTGSWNVEVDDDVNGTVMKINGFYIRPPILAIISPNVSARNSTLTVSITGNATLFAQGSQVFNVWFQQGSPTINASSFTVVNDTALNANFTIPSTALLGFWDVKVSDGYDGTITKFSGFEIKCVTVNTSFVQPNCFNGCDGSAVASVTGGTSPYSFSWNTTPGQFTASASGLCAGTYTVTVTDFTGCTGTVNVTIPQPADIVTTATINNATCFGACDGAINLTVTGGILPYTYTNLVNLCADTYSVTVTDGNGCTDISTHTVSQPSALSHTTTTNPPLCNGACNGSATIMGITGGTMPYSYSWSTTPVQTDITATGLCAGTYSVTVIDSNGCNSPSTVSVGEPPALSDTTSAVNVTCSGSCNGSATATPTGGTGAYSYSWSTSPIQTDATATGLCAITYNVTITDGNGCPFITSQVITQPLALTATTSAINVTCNGLCNGSATALPTGGTAPFAYSWSDGQSTSTATGLCAGITYTVNIIDSNNCIATSTAMVSEPGVLLANATSVDVLCNGVCNGTSTAAPTGGTTPYSYSWNTLPVQTSATATGICAGTYPNLLTVTDSNGCTALGTITVNQPLALTVSTTSVNATCGGSDGTATAAGAGGVPPYTFSWGTNPAQTAATATGLASGSYTVVLTDSNGCQNTTIATVNDAGGPVASATSTNATCGGANGTATVTLTGGTAPFAYSWSNGQTTSTATGLIAGTYSVTATDSLGCSSVGIVAVNDAGLPTASISASANVSCSSGSDGTATAAGSGGTAPYAYLWSTSPSQTNAIATGLVAGTYSVTVTDSNSCTAISSITITQPLPISLTVTGVNASCFGVNDASATVAASGGTGAYAYLWNDPNAQTASTATGLSAGTYTVTVTDVNGCDSSGSVNIAQPPTAVSTSVTSFDETNCQNNAIVLLTVSGGASPYSFAWSNGSVSEDLSGLSVGNYIVTVTDSNGCVAIDTAVVGGSVPPTLSISGINETSCSANDGIALLTVSGGATPYTYIWSNGATTKNISGLSSGTYTVSVTDSVGCDAVSSVVIGEPSPPLVNATGFNESACGANNGAAAAVITGGATPFAFSWSNGATTQNITGLAPGTYVLSVIDANGCSGSDAVVISPAPGPSITGIVGVDETSCGASDGAAVTTVSGGATPYTYNWSNGATTQNITGLSTGTYTLTVTDANGCTDVESVTLAELGNITLAVTTVNANCGSNDGSASVTASGGTTPYTYTWTSGDTTANADSLGSGIYIISVVDASGCSTSKAVTINDVGGATITVTSITAVSCNGGSNGAINITVSGGITPYTYSWSNGTVAQDISNVSAGPYEVNVTDGNNCITSASITVTQPTAIVLTTSSQQANCGSSNGSASVSASGGTGAYTYNWSTGGVDSTKSGLAAGVYTVTVTDAKGCSKTATATVSNIGGPTISVDLVIDADCGTSLGSVYISVSGGFAPYTYSWSNGSTDQDLIDVPAGQYSIIVTDTAGCQSTSSIGVSGIPPAFESICMVTVDSVTGKNLVVWEKNQTQGIKSYNIYKESTQVDVYYLIGNVPYSALSEFLDTLSNPVIRSWRYKLAVIDSCDNESEKSSDHKTIHLTINLGINNWINLIWDHYKGFSYGTYYIERYTTSTGWVTIDSVPANLSSYTDTSSLSGNLFYQVSVKPPSPCIASKAKNYNSSKSNTTSISSTSTLAVTAAAMNETAAGACNGSATATPTGGTSPYTYLWSTTPAQTNATASSLCAGPYTVTVTDASGNNISTTVTVGTTPGMDELGLSDAISVFPNPNRGIFLLEIRNIPGKAKIEIYNMLGKKIYSLQESISDKKEIDLSIQSPGIYYLKAITEKGTAYKKVVIK